MSHSHSGVQGSPGPSKKGYSWIDVYQMGASHQSSYTMGGPGAYTNLQTISALLPTITSKENNKDVETMLLMDFFLE